MLEAAVTADVFLNRDWEQVNIPNWIIPDQIFLFFLSYDILFECNVDQDFPRDPSGSFDQFKDFIRANFEMCKWIGLTVVSVQV